MAEDVLIEVQQVGKTYRSSEGEEVEALNDIGFKVKKGEKGKIIPNMEGFSQMDRKYADN